MSVCSKLHNPRSLLQVSASELDNAFNIGSANLYQFLPFSARPVYALANQVNGGPFLSNMQCVLTPKTEGCDQVNDCPCLSNMQFVLTPETQGCDQVRTDEEIDDSGKEDEGCEQNSTESGKDGEGTEGNGQESGKDGEGTEGNGQEDGKEADGTSARNGHQGCEGSGGNGRRGNWDGYQNYLLYLLTEQRKAESAENFKLLEGNNKLRAELQAFRMDTIEKIHKVELRFSGTALRIMMALFCLLLAVAQFVLELTPAGKALRERISKVFAEETDE